MPAYGDAAYWDQRYENLPAPFDWYQGWVGLEPLLKRHMPPRDSGSILQVGVGTSLLQADMVQLGGYARVVNTDISSVAIAHMAALHAAMPQLEYRVADARSMPEFPDASFRGVVDKGTLDAILCGEGASGNGTAMLQECLRVLAPGGALMVVTYGEPSVRLPLLMQQGLEWRVILYVLCSTMDEGGVLASLTPAGAGQLSPIVHGPVDVATLDSLERFSGLTNVHFVYVCIKPEAGSGGGGAAGASS